MDGLFSVRAHVFFILFSVFALAALLNVTVDDAAVTGSVVPAYLPAPSDWNQGNGCSICRTNPNPTLAYDGTWHNGRMHTGSNLAPSFEIAFEGSGLYIFFILANTVPNDTTLTNVTFFLDGIQVSSFEHVPSTSTNFEYNQAVYANGNIPFGEHTMTVMPVDSRQSVLILFDYFVYTTDNSTGTTPSPTSSSRPNIGAIVGGAVGGVAVLVLVAASVIYHWRSKRRVSRRSTLSVTSVVESNILSPEVAPASTHATPYPIQQIQIAPPLIKPASTHQPTASVSPITEQPNPISTPTQPSSNVLSNSTTEILEEVGMLRDEVARLRHDQDMRQSISELPPEYES